MATKTGKFELVPDTFLGKSGASFLRTAEVFDITACLSEENVEGTHIACPKCEDGDFVHAVSAYAFIGSDPHEKFFGTAGLPIKGKTTERRGAAALQFYCECCWSKFALVFSAYKGHVFPRVEVYGEMTQEEMDQHNNDETGRTI